MGATHNTTTEMACAKNARKTALDINLQIYTTGKKKKRKTLEELGEKR